MRLYIACAIALLNAAAAHAAGTCNFKDEINALITHNPSLQDAQKALKTLSANNYAVVNNLVDASNQNLYNYILEKFKLAETDFYSILKTSVSAKKLDCEYCDLKSAYADAITSGFPSLTKEQLIQFRTTFARIAEELNILAYLEKQGDDSNKKRRIIDTKRSIADLKRTVIVTSDPAFVKEMNSVRCIPEK
jgi:hypothetical protein